MIEFKKNGQIYFDGEEVDLTLINAEEFFIANLSVEASLEEGITLEKLMLPIGNIRNFIYSYFSEYYDRLKPIIESNKTHQLYSSIKIFKKITIEDGFLYNQPCADFIKREGDHISPMFLGMLPVHLDNNIAIIEEVQGEYIQGSLKTKITLLDILEALFEDLIMTLTEGKIE